MENIPITDQWKLDGDCLKCRRINYCSKVCSAKNNHLNKIIERAYNDVMEEKYPGYKDMLNNILTKEDK